MANEGEVIRINVNYTCPGYSDIFNVFWGQLLTDISDVALLAAIDDWVTTDWGAAWVDFASDDMTLFQFDADVINPDGTVARNIGGNVVNIAGSNAADVEPAGVAAYLLAYTSFPKSRGSKYVPGVPDLEVNDGHLSPAILVELAVLLLRFLSFDSTALAEILVAGVLSRAIEEFREFSGGGLLTDVPAYQRRRKPNVGS